MAAIRGALAAYAGGAECGQGIEAVTGKSLPDLESDWLGTFSDKSLFLSASWALVIAGVVLLAGVLAVRWMIRRRVAEETDGKAGCGMSEKERLRAEVFGDVQGVGFRAFVIRRALTYGVTGWVRNRSDGSVELLAEGQRAALDTLLEDVKDGPSGSTVDRVEVQWSPASSEFRMLRSEVIHSISNRKDAKDAKKYFLKTKNLAIFAPWR